MGMAVASFGGLTWAAPSGGFKADSASKKPTKPVFVVIFNIMY